MRRGYSVDSGFREDRMLYMPSVWKRLLGELNFLITSTRPYTTCSLCWEMRMEGSCSSRFVWGLPRWYISWYRELQVCVRKSFHIVIELAMCYVVQIGLQTGWIDYWNGICWMMETLVSSGIWVRGLSCVVCNCSRVLPDPQSMRRLSLLSRR